MEQEKRAYIQNWLARANEDIAVIDALFTHDIKLYSSSICFHAQQAAEKFLKAYLVYRNFDFPRTHDIDYLLMECQKFDNEYFMIDVKSLSDFGVSVRYPDDFFIPSIAEAEEYRSIAMAIKKIVELLIAF